MNAKNRNNVTQLRTKQMPVIRITDENEERLEALAVQMTVEAQKVVTKSEALNLLLDKELPRKKDKKEE